MFVTRRKYKREITKLQDAVKAISTESSQEIRELWVALGQSEAELRRAENLIYRSEKTNGSR